MYLKESTEKITNNEREKKTMKSIETIIKTADEITAEQLVKLINNANIDETVAKNLERVEVLAVVAFQEIEKAINTKSNKNRIVLDCNYENSHAKTAVVKIYKYDLQDCCIQVYFKHDRASKTKDTKESFHFAIATTVKDCYAKVICEKLNFVTETKKVKDKLTKSKTHNEHIAYADVVNVIKQIEAIVTENRVTKKENAIESAESAENA